MTPPLVRIRLEPLAVEFDASRGAPLLPSLAEHGIEFPCGGEGVCGGCRVRVLSGWLPITPADRGHFSPHELSNGWRLACHARAAVPLAIECGQWHMDVLTDLSGLAGAGKQGLGIAIDLGTTTIAAQMIDMSSGTVLAVETLLNPQAASGSDVMSRIRAVLDGADLATTIRAALGEVIARLSGDRPSEVAEVLLVGNTVMHHLFCGLNVEPLSHVPFASPHLGEQSFRPRDLGWLLPASCVIHFAPCIGGFVGADILAGIVAVGMAQSEELIALIDLGTNGEIAIGNRNGVVCTSTAAGPAFEAGAIRMGMRAVTGAVSHVSLAVGRMHATVIGDAPPRGICGSGLVDAVAAGLRAQSILTSGRIADGSKIFPVAGPVCLWQSDVRELQLAKGAIAAGFKLLLRHISADVNQLTSIYLAGAFGNYVQIDNALAIGLLAAPKEIIHAAGNTALRGAKMLLMRNNAPHLPEIRHISLASDPGFQDEFAACMAFPEPSAAIHNEH
jgi:uncharacterized 2Fe-2S/4Fe-4S cluster protein (DUF4445 family)